MEGVHIRIMDSMFPSLTSSNPAVQLHIHGQTRSFSILKMWPTLGNIFVPRLQTYNDQRRTLIRAVLLILDESISAWCPKTSKLGGIPNISYKPRKPIPLGNMFNNGVEYISGVLNFQDKFQGPEKKTENLLWWKSFLSGDNTIPSHTSEVLRQVEGSDIPEGGWVGGDAWFGSITAAVKVYKKIKFHSTWIIKNNKFVFPMEVIYEIIKARKKNLWDIESQWEM